VTAVRRLRAGGVGLLVVLVAMVAASGSGPAGATGGADAGLRLAAVPGLAGEPTADELARLRGREAAAGAAADREAARRAAQGAGATATPAAQVVAGGDRSIPALALRAYRTAAAWAAGFAPDCRLRWEVVAGIGRIESNHGRHGGASARFGPEGTVSPRITGPPLNGRGVAAIPDSDGGRWDGDTTWDRAVGPMQFIPTTWRSLGRDGNGDRVADPNNLFDAAVSAAGYLCLSGDGDLSDPARLRQAIYAYNHSWTYVDAVLGWARLYQGGVAAAAGPPAGSAAPSSAAPSSAAGSTSTRSKATPTPPTTQETTTSRRPTSTAPAAPPTTRPPTTRPSTTGSSSTTTTTEPCRPTTSSSSTSSSTTTTVPGGPTTSTLPPCT
jgi:membrane-bound lytic murein transglycosylase B